MGAARSVRRAARQEKEQMHEKTLDREVYRHSLEESLGDSCSGELPLKVIQSESADATDGPSDASLTKTFPMVTLAQWYVLNHGVMFLVHISLPSFYTIIVVM